LISDNIIYVIIAGIIQGLTEFLPISSSGHLIILKDIFNQDINTFDFEIMLHLGTVFSIIIYYRDYLLELFFTKNNSDNKYNIFLIIIGCIPISIIGFLCKDLIEFYFNDITLLPYSFLITSIVLFLTKYANKEYKISLKIVLIVSLFQILALLPGVSRSGITISILLYLGVNHIDATRFSFLMAIPLILGASILSLFDTGFSIISYFSIVGILISCIFGWIAIYLSNFLIKHKRYWLFSIYCFSISILIFILNFI